MHGDHVAVKILPRSSGARAEGRVLRVLDRAQPTVVGLFHYASGSRANYVVPYDARMQHHIEIPPGQELTPGLAQKLGLSGADERSLRGRRIPHLDELDGAVVNVQLLRFPKGGLPPGGRVIEVLGRPGEIGVDMLKDLGVKFCLTGHSERRHVIGEKPDLISKKAHAIYAAGLTLVL